MKNLYIILISFAFLACGNQEKNTETTEVNTIASDLIEITKEQFESENMQLGMLSTEDFNSIVKANGMIDVPPENRASVSTFVGGYVTKIPLLIGDKVQKGQLVASLQNTEFVAIQQQYLETTAQLQFLKSEYERQKTLFAEKITSQKNFFKAESAYKSNLATYNGLRKKLQMLNINPTEVEKGTITTTINLYAPISGYITNVKVSNGAYVSSASELLEIVNKDHIHIELSVFEKDILKIKKNQKIIFKVPESYNDHYLAEVHLVGTSINEHRMVKIHGHIENEEIPFITGMYIEADIFTDSKKIQAIPKSAIKENEHNYFVLALQQEKEGNYIFEKIQLKIGEQDEQYAEVLNSSAIENKKILTNGVFMLLND